MHTTIMPKPVEVTPAEPDRPPFHVAVIMDGNGRWAKARGLPRVAGHKRGAEAVRAVVEAAPALGISHLTLFGFSSENWRRPDDEVSTLMGLLRLYLRHEVGKLAEAAVRLRFIGERDRLSGDIVALMAEAESQTADNRGLVLTVALSYGGRAEIAQAARRLAAQAQAGEIAAPDIDETVFASALQTHGLPDPDLLIRTSGEQRLSNFLLWQCAYAELVFTDVLWPDFTAADLKACVAAFAGRRRRFGAVTA